LEEVKPTCHYGLGNCAGTWASSNCPDGICQKVKDNRKEAFPSVSSSSSSTNHHICWHFAVRLTKQKGHICNRKWRESKFRFEGTEGRASIHQQKASFCTQHLSFWRRQQYTGIYRIIIKPPSPFTVHTFPPPPPRQSATGRWDKFT
jgi:hypothetical protein